MVLRMNLLSSALMILWVMTIKTSAVDLAGWNPYWLSLRSFFQLRCRSFLLILDSKSLLMTLRWLMGQNIATGNGLRKHLSFKQLLDSFARIRDNSGLIFLRTTIGILFRSVAFLETLISLEISCTIDKGNKSSDSPRVADKVFANKTSNKYKHFSSG